MTREQKVRKAQQLRAKGHTHEEIGRRLGVSGSAVTKWLNPNAAEWARRSNAKRHDAKMRWGRENYRRVCDECGGATARREYSRCLECRDRAADEFQQAVIDGYRAGKTPTEIAVETWSTVASVATTAKNLRNRGIDVPFAPRGHHSHGRVAA